MSILGGAMNILGINKKSSDEKSGGFFDSLKFWDNKKAQETSQVTNEIKGELNGMFSKILVVAKGLGITTKLDEKTFADGMDKTDDKIYELFDSSSKDVENLLIEINNKINSNSKLWPKHNGLIPKLNQIKDGGKIEKTITSLPGGGILLGWIKGFTRKISWLNNLLGLDHKKLIEETNKGLDELVADLKNEEVDKEENDNKQSKEVAESKKIVSPMKDGIVTSDMDDKRNHGDHNAWDIVPSNPNEKAVVAAASGKVIKIGESDEEGNFVIIEHNINGIKYTTSYVHFDSRPNLEEGQRIEAGQYIADMGGLGAHSTGPHLHFKVKKNGEIIDPGEFLDPTQFKFKEHGKVVAFNESEHAKDYPQVA